MDDADNLLAAYVNTRWATELHPLTHYFLNPACLINGITASSKYLSSSL